MMPSGSTAIMNGPCGRNIGARDCVHSSVVVTGLSSMSTMAPSSMHSVMGAVQNTAANGTVAAMAAGAMATSNKAVMIVFIAFLFLSIWAGSSVRLAQHPLGLRARLTGVLASFRLLVALLGGRDLLLSAKHLFVDAIAWQRCDLRRRCAVGGGHELTEEKGPGRWSWGASQTGA